MPSKTKEVLQVDTDGSSTATPTDVSEKEPRHSHRTRYPVVRYGIDEFCDAATLDDKGCHIACFVSQIEQ